MGRWDLDPPRYEPGAWIRATLYPQKCDLSPDGRWFAYSALNAKADWPAGTIYEAISRLPWLHALAAWEVGTTYTRGVEFVEQPGESILGAPDVGDVAPCLARYGLRLRRPAQFAVERRRGWVETEDSPPRDEGGPWDERRAVRLRKPAPVGTAFLEVSGSYGAFRDSPQMREPVRYTLGPEGHTLDAQWADWDARGRLLLATAAGALQIRMPRDDGFELVFEEDLAALTPDPQPPPAIAHEW